MRNTVVKFGLMSGGFVSAFMVFGVVVLGGESIDYDMSEVLGYAGMIIAFSIVFVGIKSFRDRQQGGVIRFGKAFVVGLLITSIASAMYVVTWELCFRLNDDLRENFMPRYTEHAIAKLKEQGATQEELTKKRAEMEELMTMYENGAVRMALTTAEILPLGILVTLLSAAILRKKQVLPSSA